MNERYLARAKRKDALAHWGITLGGVSIIASMLVMILFMVNVTLPLFTDPEKELVAGPKLEMAATDMVVFGAGPYMERGFALSHSGEIVYFILADGRITERFSVEKPSDTATSILSARILDKETYNLAWDDGSVSALTVHYKPSFNDQGERDIHLHIEVQATMAPHENGHPTLAGLTRAADEETSWRCRVLADNTIWFSKFTKVEDFMGDITEESTEGLIEMTTRGRIAHFTVSKTGARVFAATDQGELIAWDTRDPEEIKLIDQTSVGALPVTAMETLFGDESLIVGDAEGRLAAYTIAAGKKPYLARIHEFAPHDAPITHITPSFKDKSFFALDQRGIVHMNHLTSERRLLTIGEDTPVQRFVISERGDGLLALDAAGAMFLWELKVPHPDVSAVTLWSKVHYEGYPEPVWAWQSSSASDDFEPKTSLMPLLFGSLKGTFYGMLFSLPLALFAAIYTSYMMSPKWRTIVKPVVELMAAIPSVVTGFLAALWLAPKLEANLTGLLLCMISIPLISGFGLWFAFKQGRKINGSEWLYAIPLLLFAGWIAWQLGFQVQAYLFDGNLNLWLSQKLDLAVDQRNCVVIGFALGFAVIPIIFTISEDALSNVPKHMSAAALALGSSRWQAMRRVILPMASPGIFAATMIGFGRAVGETMIVLMATGNTPIMNPSILNGMRTLSANIAVEIPEAPIDSTLYRVLFLSAVLLFTMTFVVNTAAEIVRARLSKKYKT